MAPEKNAWSPGGSSITPRSVLETTSGPRPINPPPGKAKTGTDRVSKGYKRIQARQKNQYTLSLSRIMKNQSVKKGGTIEKPTNHESKSGSNQTRNLSASTVGIRGPILSRIALVQLALTISPRHKRKTQDRHGGPDQCTTGKTESKKGHRKDRGARCLFH